MIYRYLIHVQEDLLSLGKEYLYGRIENMVSIDLDANEYDLCRELDKNPSDMYILKKYETNLSLEE